MPDIGQNDHTMLYGLIVSRKMYYAEIVFAIIGVWTVLAFIVGALFSYIIHRFPAKSERKLHSWQTKDRSFYPKDQISN